MNARYYNPAVGTFTSQDTYYGNAYSPWTQHLYSYTGANPINFIDPTGHKWDWMQTLNGIGMIALGVAAIISGGAFLLVAGIIVAAVGICETIESVTEYNPGEDLIGETAYNYVHTAANYLSTAIVFELAVTNILTSASNLVETPAKYDPAKGASGASSTDEILTTKWTENPNDLNPKGGLIKNSYNDGKIIKWQEPQTNNSIFEWNAGNSKNPLDHYHITPYGNNTRYIYPPGTNETHFLPGQNIPDDFLHYFK